MAKISTLSKTLSRDFPELTFIEGESFSWSPKDRSITYDPADPNAPSLLLHELGHAQLNHTAYSRDIALLSMETDAWEKARELAHRYIAQIDDERVEDHLDTYREWMHSRSLCPSCGATGLQIQRHEYRCLACAHEWRVNEARLCALRRYSLK